MKKFNLEYSIPIQTDEKVNTINKEWGTNYKTTGWHIDNLLEEVEALIEKCGSEGGWYVNDAIRVRVEVEYIPEDK